MNPDLYSAAPSNDLVFASTAFLFGFMPLFFAIYYFSHPLLRNAVLLAASLLFYYIGAGAIVGVLVGSVLVNHLLAKMVDRGIMRRLLLIVGIVVNLAPLAYYKYWTFAQRAMADTLALFGSPPDFEIAHILLPAGISFFTFQGISYLVDVYRGDVRPAKSVVDFGMYHTLFPQLIAGPIVRYVQIETSILNRLLSLTLIHAGIVRFMVGVAKKIILADNAGWIADRVFALPHGELSTAIAWLGTVAYTIQIYFDFSGYSDMAIGLGLMLGFRFPENFNQPYRSRSITEFWRRWHITLSLWFRDYVYIPLGGNRRGAARTYFNLVLVFFLCGLWHGAGWTFIVWGLYHGALLVFERIAYKDRDTLLPAPLAHVATLFAVMIGWVVFRSATVQDAVAHIGIMFGSRAVHDPQFPLLFYLTPDRLTLMIVAVVVAVFPFERFRIASGDPSPLATAASFAAFAYAVILVAANGFNPFIYYRF